MVSTAGKKVEFLVVDTTAFIQNAALQDIADNIVTCEEVVNEIKDKRQLRRLVVLPYDPIVKEVFPENIKFVTEFSKKTGDYPSLSATDIKVMALTYQLEKEKVGTDHIPSEPVAQKTVTTKNKPITAEVQADISGFYIPGQKSLVSNSRTPSRTVSVSSEKKHENSEDNQNSNEVFDGELSEKFKSLNCDELETVDGIDINMVLQECESENGSAEELSSGEQEDDDDDSGWITPSNVHIAKKQINSTLMEEKNVKVACLTTDFAMQNVLKQMNLNISALDGRMIKQLRSYILRCYTCFKTTSIMTKQFCPKCGNNTLKRVAYSLDEEGKIQIHINARRPLTARGKKYSLPRIKGGKHPNNPILVEDQPMPDERPSRLARTKLDPLNHDYVDGYSPFATRDINSRSAMLGIKTGNEIKHWMRKNPNESHRRRRK